MPPLKKAFRTVTSLFRSPAKKIGLPPGSLVHVGQQKVARSVCSYLDYSDELFTHRTDVSFDECRELKLRQTVSWINLDGIHDIEMINNFGAEFDLHSLMLEDILDTDHPPKFEEFENLALVILKMLYFDKESSQLEAEQISMVLTEQNVLTFQERPGDVFDGVRERLKRKSGRIRQRGSDYLIYALIDCIVDSYFYVLEGIGDRLDYLETELINRPSQEVLTQVHQLKGQLIFFRKAVWPLRELVNNMMHSESPLFAETTNVYLRDLYDHAIQVLGTVETFRETASGLIELYMSSVSQRMNEVMQVLTVMASIFIPLTFLAGIYGMNFVNMPELKWRYGYPMLWGVMILCALIMLWLFKRKKWF